MKETINMLFKKSALVIAASLLAMGAAHSGTIASVPLNISVTVVPAAGATTCSVTAGGMVTGTPVTSTYTSGSASAGGGYGNVNVTCDGNVATPFVISANAGQNATATSRRAVNGTDYINYQLHIVTGFGGMAPIWDTAIAPSFGGSTFSSSTSGGTFNSTGGSFNLTVPAGQTAPQNTYTDVVTLTGTF